MTYSRQNMTKQSILVVMAFLLLAFLPVRSVYSGTIGSEFPIATTAERERSIGVSFDGTNYLVGIQGDADAHYNVGAQLVSQSGTLVGPLISTGRTGGLPLVAFDGTNYLMVWEDDANHPNIEIYGQFISTSGTLVGAPFPINQDSSTDELSGIAFDGTNYLIVWESLLGDYTETIDGQFVSQSGNIIGSKFLISGNSVDQASAAIAFDGTNYLVVWSDASRLGTGLAEDIYGQFVTPSGILSGSKFLINQNDYPSDNPVAVTFNGTNYLVVWEDQIGYPDGEWNLFGQLVGTSGNVVGGVINVSTALGNQHFPFIAFDGSNYLVTWTDMRNDVNKDFVCDIGEGTCIDIYGQYISPNGSLIDSEFPIVMAAGNQFLSPLASDGSKYLVAWTSGDTIVGDVYGIFVDGVPQLEPVPDIKANDSDEPITISPDDTLTVIVSLDPNDMNGEAGDWWMVADTPFSWYHYNVGNGSWIPGFAVTHQGPLFDLTLFEVLNRSGLPIGAYTFYFGVDMIMNGSLDMDQIYYDNVEVNIE